MNIKLLINTESRNIIWRVTNKNDEIIFTNASAPKIRKDHSAQEIEKITRLLAIYAQNLLNLTKPELQLKSKEIGIHDKESEKNYEAHKEKTRAARILGWDNGKKSGKYKLNRTDLSPERRHDYSDRDQGIAYEDAFMLGENARENEENPFRQT